MVPKLRFCPRRERKLIRNRNPASIFASDRYATSGRLEVKRRENADQAVHQSGLVMGEKPLQAVTGTVPYYSERLMEKENGGAVLYSDLRSEMRG